MSKRLRRRTLPLGGAVLLLWGIGFSGDARAADNAASDDASPSTTDSTGGDVASKTEFAIVPLVGGDSDLGVGGGALGSLTNLVKGLTPYRWRLEAGLVITVKPPSQGMGFVSPYQDAYLVYTVPDLIYHRMRLEVRPSYTRETTQAYYGIGNGSLAPTEGPNGQSASSYFQYGRMHPTLLARLQLKLHEQLSLLVGNTLTYNEIDITPDSQLAVDANSGAPEVRRFFGPLKPHWVDLFEYGLVFDSRDNENVTTNGMFHHVKVRLSPGGSDAFPYRYGQVNAIFRFYLSPVRHVLTLAARAVADVQFGTPPFYELAKYEDTFAFGGVNGVRGIPGQRYYGKLKFFANIEARAHVVSFPLFSKECSLGLAAFFDGGQLFADWDRHSSLDSASSTLKYGVGGGLRFYQGQAFVVRADVAWSPDARPLGGYFTAGESF